MQCSLLGAKVPKHKSVVTGDVQTKTTRHLRPQPPGRLALQEPRLGSDLVPAAALPGAFDTDMSCGKELLPVGRLWDLFDTDRYLTQISGPPIATTPVVLMHKSSWVPCWHNYTADVIV